MFSKLKSKINEGYKLPLHFSLILIIIFSLLLTCMMLYVQPFHKPEIIELIKLSNGLVFWVNFLPILLVSFFIFFLFNNFALTTFISGILVLILAFTNRSKIEMRHDPLLPWDFMLFVETTEIIKNTSILIFVSVFLCLLLFGFLFFIFNKIFKSKKMKLVTRVFFIVVLIIFSSYANKKLYKNADIYKSMQVNGNVYDLVNNYNSRGFLYSFIYDLNNNIFKIDPNYSKKEAYSLEKIDDKAFEEIKEREKPHVIAVMAEAFSEISIDPSFDFEGFDDPLNNYKDIKEKSIYGNIVVPGIGGGTAETEFDFLTGLSARNFRGVPFAYRIVNRDIKSLPRTLTKIGYDNIAIHPGQPWFYNRDNVYKNLGFSNFINIESFTEEDMYIAMYVKESYTIDEVIKQFENHTKQSDKPFFDFCVTIQNHGPYTGKYAVPNNFKSSLNITEENYEELSNYFYGLNIVDNELKRLYDYVNNSDEPIVFIYFGDHMPSLETSLFNKLVNENNDIIDEHTKRYTVPYLIIQNDAAKRLVDFDETIKQINLPKYNKISSNYLSAVLLKLMNLEYADTYFKYNLDMMQKYPILLEKIYYDFEGNFYEDSTQDEEITKYKFLQYYKMFDEK